MTQIKVYAGADTTAKWERICEGFTSNTAAFAVIVDRYYQREYGETDEMNEKTQIWGTIYTGELFDNYQGDALELIDQAASEEAWAAMVETALERIADEHDLDVDIEIKRGVGPERIEAHSDTGDKPWELERDAMDVVNEVFADIYMDPGWIRYTRHGLAAYLEDGFWFERSDGIIVSVGEIETANGPAWQLSYHKGEMPAHSVEVFETRGAVLEKMLNIAHAEEWRPREA